MVFQFFPSFYWFYFDCVFFMLYIEGGIFLTIQWFDLNSSSKNLFERLSIKDFFVDNSVHFLMCLCILFIALKILKFSLSGLILINT